MKQNDIDNLEQLKNTDMANLFNLYLDKKLSDNGITYNINRTVNLVGLDNIASITYNTYNVIDNDTWPLISYKNYNTTRLWWLVCKMNGITNPTQDPVVGTTIKILTQRYVDIILTEIRKN